MMVAESAVYKRTVLSNGLKVITEAIPHVRSVSLGLWLNVGSRDETESSLGVSHFIEHMVFKGTKSRDASQIASYLESVGGVINAFTSREETCFYAKFLDQHLPLAVELLFDLINNPLLDLKEIEKEKRVVLEEIKDIEDAPSDLVHDKFARAIFGAHPLGWPIQGTRTTVKGLNKGVITSHIKRFYRPDRIVVAASGNLDHLQLERLVLENFNILGSKSDADGRQRPEFTPVRKIFKRKSAQTHVCLGIPAKDFNHPSRTPLLLLNSLLGGGMSSRLFQRVREDLGFAYNVFSYLDYFQDTGIFGIYLGADKKNVKRAIAAVIGEMDRICNEKLSEDDLSRIKEQLKGNLMLGLENTSNRMNRLAKHEFLTGRYISLDETVGSIDCVKADDITDIAREIFVKDRFTAVTMGPVDKSIYAALDG
jgi:predicted Zn-dependent peptidase